MVCIQTIEFPTVPGTRKLRSSWTIIDRMPLILFHNLVWFMVICRAPGIRRSTIINLINHYQSHDSVFIENVFVLNPLLLQVVLMRTRKKP